MKRACVFFAEGTEECEALLPVDLLRRAGIEVTLAAVSDSKTVTSSHGVPIQTDALAGELDFSRFDLIVLPGGMPGTRNLAASEAVVRAARLAAADPSKLLAAVCAAPTVLAGLGLLEGRRATVHHGFRDQMRDAVLVDKPVVEDGNIITGWGLGASIPFSLRLTARLCGPGEADRIREAIGYPFNF